MHFGEISRHELDSSIREFPLSLAPLTLAEACRVRPKPTTPVTPLINSRGMELAVVKVNEINQSVSAYRVGIRTSTSVLINLL